MKLHGGGREVEFESMALITLASMKGEGAAAEAAAEAKKAEGKAGDEGSAAAALQEHMKAVEPYEADDGKAGEASKKGNESDEGDVAAGPVRKAPKITVGPPTIPDHRVGTRAILQLTYSRGR